MATQPDSKTKFEIKLSTLMEGVQNDLPSSVKGVPLTGQFITLAQAEQTAQQYLSSGDAVVAAQVSLSQAMTARKALDPQAHELYANLVTLVKQLFAGNAVMLAKFGIVAKAKATRSAADKAATVTKQKATLQRKKAALAALTAAGAAPVATAPVVAATPAPAVAEVSAAKS